MTLREAAAGAGVEIGVCATCEALADDRYAELLATEFDRLAVENDLKWGPVRPDRRTFAFEPADELVDFAGRHAMAVTGHALVWHIDNPDWLEEQDWRADDLEAELRSHIRSVTSRYAGRIDTWDVVNEAVNDDGELRETLWLERLGEAYIHDAFLFAAENTDADLYYNEYGLPYNQAKRDRVYRLLGDLLDRGAPVDGVGIQLHCVGVQPDPDRIRETIRRFHELGLDVRVTELDVAFDRDERPEDLEAVQAAYYDQTVEACLDAGVEGITVWGVTDDRSWITSWRDYPDRYTQRPLLFDADGRKKESYRAVESVLRDHQAG